MNSDPQFVQLKGTVTLDGQPVPHASVVFAPKNPAQGKLAVGLTDDHGQFTLYTDRQPGVHKASYTVTVFAQERAANRRPGIGPSGTESTPTAPDFARTAPKLLVPEKYTKPETSGLTFTVGQDGKSAKLALVTATD